MKKIFNKLYIVSLLFLAPQMAFSQAIINSNKNTITKNLVTDFNAVSNDSIDDSYALKTAMNWFSNIDENGNTVKNIDYTKSNGKLIIPSGIFYLGDQQVNKNINDNIPFAKPKNQGSFFNKNSPIDGLIIQGATPINGNFPTKFIYKKNLYYGCFNPTTLQPEIGENKENLGSPGFAFMFGWNVQNVIIQNLEINGRSDKYIVGGATIKGSGWQVFNYGITLQGGCKNYTLKNLYIHHFGTDGIGVVTTTGDASPNTTNWNVYLENVVSSYNGRQALTWTGGTGLKAINCEFSYTGMFDKSTRGILNSPGANFDMEDDGTGDGKIIQNGYFENCKFINNAGMSGSINIASNINNLVFKNCTISSNGANGISLNFANYRDFTFNSCNILGNIDFTRSASLNVPFKNTGKTIFNNCNITSNNFGDKDNALVCVYDKTQFNSCNFTISSLRNFINVNRINNANATLPQNFNEINNCNFIYKYSSEINSPQPSPGRISNIIFKGTNKFFKGTNCISQPIKTPFTTTFYNNIVQGSLTSKIDTFMFGPYNMYDCYNYDFYVQAAKATTINNPIIFGENPCEKLVVILNGDNAAFYNNSRDLYINKNTTFIVKSGSTLMLAGNIYLYGKLIIENGGKICNMNQVFFIPTSDNIQQHLIVNATNSYGVPSYMWNPGCNPTSYTVQKVKAANLTPTANLVVDIVNCN